MVAQEGANADALSHEDYLNGAGQKVSSKFTTPGKYLYHCEPHQSAGGHPSAAPFGCLVPLCHVKCSILHVSSCDGA